LDLALFLRMMVSSPAISAGADSGDNEHGKDRELTHHTRCTSEKRQRSNGGQKLSDSQMISAGHETCLGRLGGRWLVADGEMIELFPHPRRRGVACR
jgi:hypothetical protein